MEPVRAVSLGSDQASGGEALSEELVKILKIIGVRYSVTYDDSNAPHALYQLISDIADAFELAEKEAYKAAGWKQWQGRPM